MPKIAVRKSSPGKRPVGRPKGTTKLQPTDETISTIINLGKIQCTQEEVASVLGVNTLTLIEFLKRHPELKDKFYAAQAEGQASLRRLQFRHAQRSVPMSIWLGKQYLKQADKQSTDVNANVTNAVQINVVVEGEASLQATSDGDTKTIDHEPEALVIDHAGRKHKADV